jgi:hypothetical protein
MRINVAVPDARVSADVLDSALEAVTRLDESMIEHGTPTFHSALKAGRVKWRPEPPGQEHFDHAGVVLQRGHGDCDDLAPWHAASLRATGRDPEAEAFVRQSGPNRWHAIVRRGDGTIEDPSAEAGMYQYQAQARNGIHGAALPLILSGAHVGTYVARPQLMIRPLKNPGGGLEAWQARADLPWHTLPSRSPGDVALVSLHRSPVASQSIVGCCRGAVRLGEESGDVDEDDLDRVSAIADLCDGADWYELAGVYGEEHADAAVALVGSIFGGLAKIVKKAFPLAKQAIKFVPGVGPAASLAFDMIPVHGAKRGKPKRVVLHHRPGEDRAKQTGAKHARARGAGYHGLDVRIRHNT